MTRADLHHRLIWVEWVHRPSQRSGQGAILHLLMMNHVSHLQIHLRSSVKFQKCTSTIHKFEKAVVNALIRWIYCKKNLPDVHQQPVVTASSHCYWPPPTMTTLSSRYFALIIEPFEVGDDQEPSPEWKKAKFKFFKTPVHIYKLIIGTFD